MFPDPETVKKALDMWGRFGPGRGVDHPGTPLSDLNAIVAAAQGFLALHQAISQPTGNLVGHVADAIAQEYVAGLGSWHIDKRAARAALAAVASVLLASGEEPI